VYFLVKRVLSLVDVKAFRLPRMEKALTIDCEGFDGVSYLLLLVFSRENSGGDEGGLDAMISSEKMALSLGIGVDEIFGGDILTGYSCVVLKL
jgi:hypothetical protein